MICIKLWICHWPKAQESGVSQDEAWKMPRYLHCENTSQLRREHVSTGKKHQCWNSWQETIIQRELPIQEKAVLYTLFYRWHPQRSSSAWIHWDGGLELMVYWSTVTDGNNSANNWPVLRQSLHTVYLQFGWLLMSCMYVFSNLILTLKLERNPTLCEKKEKLPRTPCRSFPLPSKEVWAQD